MKLISNYLTIILFISCQNGIQKKTEYQLIWSDEFNQKVQTVDTSKWFLETKAPNNGSWYNDELQHYTDRIENSYVSEGTLKIIAKKEQYTHSGSTQQYTSARLNLQRQFQQFFHQAKVRNMASYLETALHLSL